jgi:hypothetical protein
MKRDESLSPSLFTFHSYFATIHHYCYYDFMTARGARLPWAQEAPGSNPGAPTKNISRVFFYLLKAPFTSNLICGILADRRSGFASHLISETSLHAAFCKNIRRQECNLESIERRQVKRAPSGKYGENHGGPMHSSCHRNSEM